MKIKNTSAVALRAAYLHGPYTLYVACYPATFDPNTKHDDSGQGGVPQFEPNLKAGGSWNAQLKVPEKIRETAGKANVRRTTDGGAPSVTWILEVCSQVIFSNTAAVHFEILVGRDEKSIDLGLAGMTGAGHAVPGQLQDHQQGRRNKEGRNAAHAKGVYSKSVSLVVDDTASLWNKPRLPEWEDEGKDRGHSDGYHAPGGDMVTLKPIRDKSPQCGVDATTKVKSGKSRKRRKIHLVVLTHGLHSNLGADMLYLKESIDAAAKQARIDARNWKARHESEAPLIPAEGDSTDHKAPTVTNEVKDKTTSSAPLSGGQDDLLSRETEDDEEEEVIVRGFPGNAIRTERGIQYLGKRLAKYVLAMTYPDQPYLPTKKSVSKTISRALTGQDPSDVPAGLPSHHTSSIHKESTNTSHLAYQITSISFLGHSLGGLTQTYAIAYIHKHSPDFFKKIKPINFISLASPFLGLSNENPIYVKFALDFGLVGRTGQDLGLTWRAPTMVRNGWEAMIGGIGADGKRAHRQPDVSTKPLLRVLPTGPAHQVLKMFRNRTVYSNVVNDGIVPLRTSCLLFLDWRGLGRVEKARRENGLVGTMAGWGWAELTGANSTAKKMSLALFDGDASSADNSADEGINTPTENGAGDTVPQPSDEATNDEATVQVPEGHANNANLGAEGARFKDEEYDARRSQPNSPVQPTSPFAAFLSLLRPGHKQTSHHHSHRHTKIYKRSQVMGGGEDGDDGSPDIDSTNKTPNSPPRSGVSWGDSMEGNEENLFTPPKTTVFEAAGDILNPPIPDEEFLMNPKSRPRTIFHDRVYHPEDIPPPPVKRRSSILRTFSSEGKDDRTGTATETDRSSNVTSSGMKLEEKIARAYHKDLSWRKVLVRLEPDAHNNMIVRRMFANAYGWPVVKHLVDTHFADTYSANTADNRETGEERAKPMDEDTGTHGEEVRGQLQKDHEQSESERRETDDHVSELKSPTDTILSSSSKRPQYLRNDSGTWDDRYFDSTDNDDEDDEEYEAIPGIRHRVNSRASYKSMGGPRTPKGTSDEEIADFLHGSKPQEQNDTPKPWQQASSTSGPRPRSIVVPASPTSTNTSGLGLGKSIEEHLATAKITDSERAEHLAMINDKPTFGSIVNDETRNS